MATRRDETDSAPRAARKKAPGAKAAPRRKAAAKEPSTQAKGTVSTKGLLRAGLQALGNVRDDVVKHQTNVIETLLGMPKSDDPASKSAAARAFPALDIGLRKFEDVFDQRVAAAMQRLGLPAAQEVEALREQVRQLQARVEQLEGRDSTPRRKR